MLVLFTALQRRVGDVDMHSLMGWAILIIAIIIGGGLLLYAVKLTIANFVPDEWKAKVQALVYILVALLLAGLVFHWGGLV